MLFQSWAEFGVCTAATRHLDEGDVRVGSGPGRWSPLPRSSSHSSGRASRHCPNSRRHGSSHPSAGRGCPASSAIRHVLGRTLTPQCRHTMTIFTDFSDFLGRYSSHSRVLFHMTTISYDHVFFSGIVLRRN